MAENGKDEGETPRERSGVDIADWSAAGWVAGFVIGWLIFDSVTMGLLYAIIFGVSMAAAPRKKAD